MLSTTKHKLTDEGKVIISQALWDMNLSPEEFLDIIEGRSDRKFGYCRRQVVI